MAETLTIRTASSTEVVKIAVPGPQGPKGDKGDPGDVAGLPLSTLGDTLYRGASENQRLPIGTSGQILKVSAGGIPEWGAAPATGVTSVALASSDLTITGSPITSSGTITANVTVNGLTLNKLETINTAHFLGRHGIGAGDVQPVSASQARTILNVADGAEANVQSNWTEADSGSDAFILNKPSTFAPTAHAAAHGALGSDPLFDQDLNQADSVQFDGLRVVSAASQTVAKQVLVADDEGLIVGITGNEADARASLGLGVAATADIGTGSTEVAAGNHVHGNLTNDGKLGSTSGLPVVTTTAGAVTTLSLGTANQVLRVNSGATGVEFADPAASGVTGAASSASDVLGVSGANITGVDANADRIIFWDDSASALKHLTVGSGLSLTDTTLTATGGGVTTGSVDNAVLRADGTGGSTSQSSDINIEDATTSTANNVTISNQHSGQTNSSLVLQPKGTGAFILGEKPAATSSSGNARGASAVDLQLIRTNAARVASGLRSALLGGANNTASGQDAVAIGGNDNTASGFQSIVLGGRNNTASADRSVAIADGNTSSGTNSIAMGAGNTASASQSLAICSQSRADRVNLFAHGSGAFSTAGDAQRIRAVLRCKTTTNAAVEMALDGSTTYLTIPSGKVIYAEIRVVGTKSDGSAVATYARQYAAKNVAGTSSEVYAAVTIGTDNAASTSLEVATVDAGDYIRIRPTGITSETWRWVASVDAVEVAYGT